ncbi:MAG: hypothetical protein ACRCTQ_03600 [Brevinemataceae bacterium]
MLSVFIVVQNHTSISAIPYYTEHPRWKFLACIRLGKQKTQYQDLARIPDSENQKKYAE